RTLIATSFPPQFLHRNRMLPMKLCRVTPPRSAPVLGNVGNHAPAVGDAPPLPAHPLVVLTILGGFSRTGPYCILFGFGQGLLDLWRFAQAGQRDKPSVPRQQSAWRRHGQSFPDAPSVRDCSPSSGAYSV